MATVTTPHLPARPAQAPAWLDVIHAVNGSAPGAFGEPDAYGDHPDFPGRYVEQHPAAYVVLPYTPEGERPDPSGVASIVSRTPEGDALIRRAAADLGLDVTA